MAKTATKNDDGTMPFIEHLRELRGRLKWCVVGVIIGFCIAFSTYEYIQSYMLNALREEGITIKFDTVLGPFVTKLKVSLIFGIFISLPVILYHILGFITPALTPKERKVVHISLFSSTFLAIGGFLLCFIYVLPFLVRFMMGVTPEDTEFMPEFMDTIGVIVKLLVAFMALFQMPIILVALMALGLVKRAFLLRNTRYIIVIIFILSAFITPPDPVSLVLLSLPLILLFLLSILVAKICGFGNPDKEDEIEDAV